MLFINGAIRERYNGTDRVQFLRPGSTNRTLPVKTHSRLSVEFESCQQKNRSKRNKPLLVTSRVDRRTGAGVCGKTIRVVIATNAVRFIRKRLSFKVVVRWNR